MSVNKLHICLLYIVFLSGRTTLGVWRCESNADCYTTEGSICADNQCVCPVGQELVLGGTRCFDAAPYYHLSSCMEDFQCSRLVAGFACNSNAGQGFCDCAPGQHFYRGRCWPSREYGDSCIRDEECQSILRNPFNMQCLNGACTCAEGYYLRQRGECRQIGHGVGDPCVLNVDCQFENGLCHQPTFTCYNSQEGLPETRIHNESHLDFKAIQLAPRQDRTACVEGACEPPFVCTAQNLCVCPVGFYPNEEGTTCLAHLGTPSTEEQCVGVFKEVRDGVCTCPVNFYYEPNMRDCAKATLRLTDFCLSDAMCHTFGSASYCSAPSEDFALRSCQCNAELAVRNEDQAICLLFRGLDEECDSDNECYAGDRPILCVADDSGLRRCVCPDGLAPDNGLCLASELDLGESCQVTAECRVENADCLNSVCSCLPGFQHIDDICSPEIGSACVQDVDCVIPNTECVTKDDERTCQCVAGYVVFEDECLQDSEGYEANCTESVQCHNALGEGSHCVENVCRCLDSYHYANEECWRSVDLLGECSRRIECFLGDLTERVVCRNGLCQCDFSYEYIEETNTCDGPGSSASNIIVGTGALWLAIILRFVQRYI